MRQSYKPSPADYWILLTLSEGKKRPSELAEKFPKATVAKELNLLEKYRYVKRKVISSKPLQVSYGIAPKGKDFLQYKTAEVAKQLEEELSEKLRLMNTISPEPTMELVSTISRLIIPR